MGFGVACVLFSFQCLEEFVQLESCWNVKKFHTFLYFWKQKGNCLVPHLPLSWHTQTKKQRRRCPCPGKCSVSTFFGFLCTYVPKKFKIYKFGSEKVEDGDPVNLGGGELWQRGHGCNQKPKPGCCQVKVGCCGLSLMWMFFFIQGWLSIQRRRQGSEPVWKL